MHSHSFYSISWFYTGEGEHHVDFDSYSIEKDTLFFLSPKHLHSYSHLNNVSGINIIFTENFLLHFSPELQNKIKASLFCPIIGVSHCKISGSAKERLERYVYLMQEEMDLVQDDKSLRTDFLASVLSLFLIDVIRLGEWKNLKQIDVFAESYQLYEKFTNLIKSNFTKYHTVKEYLLELNVSQRTLNRCTQQYAKMPPLKLINEYIMNEAKRMVRFSSLSVKEIASELGYEDSSYFSKVFEREVGKSPTEFKELNKIEV